MEKDKEIIFSEIEKSLKEYNENGYSFHSESPGSIGISNKKFTIMATPFWNNSNTVAIDISRNGHDGIESYEEKIPFQLKKENKEKISEYYINKIIPDAINQIDKKNENIELNNKAKKLIGKKLKIDNEKEKEILEVNELNSPYNKYYEFKLKNRIHKITLTSDQFELLIENGYYDAGFEKYELVNFKKMKSNKITVNQPEYKYYIVSQKGSGKIIEGFEFKEDAKERLRNDLPTSINGSVVSKRDLKNDPQDDSNWGNAMDVNSDVIERANRYYENYVNEEISEFFKSTGLPQQNEKPNLSDKQILELYSECILKKIKSANYYGLTKTGNILFNEYNKVRETISQL